MKKIVIIGPAYPLRGGLATFNQRLAAEFLNEGHDCIIYSFSLQYPSFLFPGTTQYSSDPPPSAPPIITRINSVNPFNWFSVGNELKKIKPDIVVVRYWLPFMGPALGTILRRIKKNRYSKVIAITDNVIPHEKRPGDRVFTKYFLRSCDAFITMSEKVLADLKSFHTGKPALFVKHPLYDTFGMPVAKAEARKAVQLDGERPVLLFFGFIRKYKGLDLLLDAIKRLKEIWPGEHGPLPLLVVAGEFYEESEPYLQQIERLQINDLVVLRTRFIPDNEVRNYLCAADAVVQPYRTATQSGVTPLAYHFERPMIVTNVGSLPDLVPDGEVGIVCEPDPASLANAIVRFYQLGEHSFIAHLRREKSKYSWQGLVSAILQLAGNVSRTIKNEKKGE